MATQARYILNRYPWLASVVTNPGAGDVIFVDGVNGANARDGTTPETAVLTITQGLTLATAGEDDYIIILAYPSAGAAGETWPIAVDIDNVHIIGVNLFNASTTAWVVPTGNTAAFSLSANMTEIAGLDLGAGAAHACIENNGTAWRAHIHDNEIGIMRTCQDGIGIGLGSVDCPHWLVENNTFGHLTNISRDGIRIEQNSTRSIFRNNRFYVNTGCVGIHLQGLCTAIGYIMDNSFKVADAAAGEAIYVENVNASVCQFHGNRVASGNVAMAFNPYRDLGADCHWSINYAGTAATYPVTV